MAKSDHTVDLGKICRTCLNESVEVKSIFEQDDSTITTTGQPMMIAEMLLGFANVQVENQDGLPSLVCTQCVNQICQAFCFKQLCEQSDTNLRTYLGKPLINGSDSKMKEEEITATSGDYIIEGNNLFLDDFGTAGDSSSDDEMDEYTEELISISQLLPDPPNENDAKIIAQRQLIKVSKINRKFIKKGDKPSNKGGEKEGIKKKKCTEQCNVCKKHFINFKSFRKHLRSHIEERPHSCKECNKTFTEEVYLNNHMRTHIPNEDKPHKCEVCEKRFFHPSFLEKHMIKHGDEKPYICKICNKGCYAENSLLKHMRIHEKKEGDPGLLKHICDYCRTEFSDANTLSVHIKQHTGDRPFLCNLCGKTFPQRFNLDLHLRTHTGERPFHCEVCKNGYVSKASLKIHMRTHTNERPYVCDFCGKAFRQSGDLASHKRLHGTEKPIECEICNKTFTTVMKLKYHMRNHTGERPYVCKVCNRGFTVNTILLRHMRVHSGERPYVCVTCGKAFSQSSTLNTHMKVHSNAKVKKEVIREEYRQVERPKYSLPPITEHEQQQHNMMQPTHQPDISSGGHIGETTRNAVYVVTEANRIPSMTDNNRILVEQDTRLVNAQVIADGGRILTDNKYIPTYDIYRQQHM